MGEFILPGHMEGITERDWGLHWYFSLSPPRGESNGVESATVLELRGFMCVWAELKPRATWLEPAVLCRQAPGCLSHRVISTATAPHIYGSVLMPPCPHSHLCFQVPNPEVESKKENKENKGSINSASVVSCRCVKYYRWRLYWLYGSLSALNAFSLSCPQLTCVIGYLLSENFLKVIFLQFDQGDRRDAVENMHFCIYLEGKPLGFLSISWTLSFFSPT